MTSLILLRTWMESQIEFWKPIPGWTMYEVSNWGRVRSYWRTESDGYTFWRTLNRQPRTLSPHWDKRGYARVILRDGPRSKTTTIHRLVMLAFVQNPENHPDVNHLSAVRADNRLENLEWASKSRNMRHAFDHGLNKPRLGIANGMAKFTDDEVREIRRIGQSASGKRIAEHYKVTPTLISRILLGRTYKHVK